MTSRRESAVRIVEIIPRCGPYRNQECTGETAPGPGEDALFGVVVQNLSPTGTDLRVHCSLRIPTSILLT